MSKPDQIGILYDVNVHNYQIVSKVMWWHAAGVEFHICTDETSPAFEEGVLDFYARFPSIITSHVNGPVFVKELPLDDLDGLIVIRSHPEMFGREIQRVLTNDPSEGVDVWTIENYPRRLPS